MSGFSRTPSEGVAFNRIPSFVSDDGNGEMSNANDDEVLLVRYKDEMHNIHGFLNQHPGGRSILEKYENKDITAAFDDINHSAFASAKLSSFKLEDNKLAGQEVSLKKYNKVDTNFVIKKLFTKEDQTNIHKVLGFLTLFSYIYRYGKLYLISTVMFIEYSITLFYVFFYIYSVCLPYYWYFGVCW